MKHIEPTSADEYERLLPAFPFTMPPGYRLPAASAWPLQVGERAIPWALGEQYFTWRGAVASSAVSAHECGDEVTRDELLNDIRDSYRSDLRRSIIDDPNEGYIVDVIEPALHGDLSELIRQDVDAFRNRQRTGF